MAGGRCQPARTPAASPASCAHASAPRCAARRPSSPKARPPTITGIPSRCAASMRRTAPARNVGTLHDTASARLLIARETPRPLRRESRRRARSRSRRTRAQRLAEHLGRERMPIALGACNNSQVTIGRHGRLAGEGVERGGGDAGCDVFVGGRELVSVPAFAHLLLRRPEKVLDDRGTRGTRWSSRSSVSRIAGRRCPAIAASR